MQRENNKIIKMKLLIFAVFVNISLIQSVPVENSNDNIERDVMNNDNNFMKKDKVDISVLFSDIQKLKAKKSPDEIRRITTAGILAGAIKVERNMNEHLGALTQDFFKNFNSSTPEDNMEKLYNLEQTMERDKRAMEILGNALDFAINSKSYEEYKEDMDAIARESEISLLELAKKKFATQMAKNNTSKGEKVGRLLKHSDDLKNELTNRMHEVRSSINKHLFSVHSTLKSRTKKTIKYLKVSKPTPKPGLDLSLLKNIIQPKTTLTYETTTELSSDYTDQSGYQTFPPSEKESRLAGLLNRLKRQDDNSKPENDKENEIEGSIAMSMEKQSESQSESGSESSEEGPGGLVGLIASLSGGDEGSDIGALIGALTGLVTNLFGPGGLDIPSLLGTATGLISGLLAGDENFGKVLGSYVGVAVDGFSGGGGAILNGQFFGQFLGTVFAQLSADPEDDELPPKPKLFIENVFSGSKMATSKAGEGATDGKEGEHPAKPGGSDIFGFITNVVSSIVGGITSLILNASLGSSGGSSQGSADLSGGSSAASSSSSTDSNSDPNHHH